MKTTQSYNKNKETKGKEILHLIGKICKIVLPIAISVILIIWLLHEVNYKEVVEVIHQGIRLEWIFLMMFLTMLSFIIRGIRWGIQLRAAGVPRMSVTAESVSIFGAYALNLLVQYLGEAWRCVYVAKKKKVKVSTVVGTDLGDRGSDAVMILLILALTLCFASEKIHQFFNTYKLGETLEHIFSIWELYVGLAVVVIGFIFADKKWKNTKFFSGFNTSFLRIWDGFKVLFFMKGRWAYLYLTFAIWICYFLETYSCFYAFSFTRELINQPGTAYGLIPGLVVFVFGSFSMAVPSNGGLGAWNIAVTYGLMLYGISKADAITYSLVVWGFQAAMIIALGIFSAIYVLVTKTSDVQITSAQEKTAQELHS